MLFQRQVYCGVCNIIVSNKIHGQRVIFVGDRNSGPVDRSHLKKDFFEIASNVASHKYNKKIKQDIYIKLGAII